MFEGPRLVLASFDPGCADGWCILRVPVSGALRLGQVGSIPLMKVMVGEYSTGSTSGNVDRAVALCRLAYEEVCEEGDLFVVVQEDFSLRMLSSDPALLEPVRWMAVWDDRYASGFPHPVFRQMPSEKTTINDQRIRLWGLWPVSVTPAGHGRDAMRHALVFLRRFITSREIREECGFMK